MRQAGVHHWMVVPAALGLASAGCGGDPDPLALPTSPAGPASPAIPAGEPILRPVAVPEPGPGQHELTASRTLAESFSAHGR